VIECEPTERFVGEKVATPLALTGDEPRLVLPSLNVTVPVGVPVPDAGVTLAANVTFCPRTEGLGDEVKDVDVPTILTVCISTDDVLVA
jgi:hypothetical protein